MHTGHRWTTRTIRDFLVLFRDFPVTDWHMRRGGTLFFYFSARCLRVIKITRTDRHKPQIRGSLRLNITRLRLNITHLQFFGPRGFSRTRRAASGRGQLRPRESRRRLVAVVSRRWVALSRKQRRELRSWQKRQFVTQSCFRKSLKREFARRGG